MCENKKRGRISYPFGHSGERCWSSGRPGPTGRTDTHTPDAHRHAHKIRTRTGHVPPNTRRRMSVSSGSRRRRGCSQRTTEARGDKCHRGRVRTSEKDSLRVLDSGPSTGSARPHLPSARGASRAVTQVGAGRPSPRSTQRKGGPYGRYNFDRSEVRLSPRLVKRHTSLGAVLDGRRLEAPSTLPHGTCLGVPRGTLRSYGRDRGRTGAVIGGPGTKGTPVRHGPRTHSLRNRLTGVKGREK